MKFEIVEKCGREWFDTLTEAEKRAARELAYRAFVDTEGLELRLHALGQLVGQQDGDTQIADIGGLALLISDLAEDVGEMSRFCQSLAQELRV